MVAVVLGWLAVVSPAGAATGTIVASPKYIPASGPVLAGDRGVLWVTRRGDRVLELWAWTPAGGTRRLQRFGTVKGYDLNQPGFFGSAYLSASSTHVGMELHTTYAAKGVEGSILNQTFLGRLGKRIRQVRQCRVQRFQRSLEVEGTTAVFRGPTCDQTVTRELSVGAGSDRRFGGEIFATRLSDPPEAWVEPTALEPTAPPRDAGAVVVRDRRTSSELTRAPVDPLPSDISLRADGTLAFATAARPYDDHYDARVAVLDPGATTSRILPVRLRSRLNGWIGPDLGVVAADRRDSNSGALQLIDAQGRTTRRIAELGEDPALLKSQRSHRPTPIAREASAPG